MQIVLPECKLELWPGYLSSIRQHERDILMCVEITNKVMRLETLVDILNNCYQENRDRYRVSCTFFNCLDFYCNFCVKITFPSFLSRKA